MLILFRNKAILSYPYYWRFRNVSGTCELEFNYSSLILGDSKSVAVTVVAELVSGMLKPASG